MDKSFVKENNLTEDVKRFVELSSYKSPRQSLHEYTFVNNKEMLTDGELDEEGEEQQEQQPPMDAQGAPQQPPMDNQGGQPQQAPMDQQGAPQQPPMDAQGGQPPMDSQMPMDDGSVEMPPMDGEMPPMEDGIETQEMEPDDEVIDVDDLTQSQEATEYKLDGVDERLSELSSFISKFGDVLQNISDKTDALKDELEKRNPTEEEKLNIRTQSSSYPFSEQPKEYWDRLKATNPHYDVMYNNDVAPEDEQEEFQIRKGDIKDLDMKSIADTLNFKPKLNDYIGF